MLPLKTYKTPDKAFHLQIASTIDDWSSMLTSFRLPEHPKKAPHIQNYPYPIASKITVGSFLFSQIAQPEPWDSYLMYNADNNTIIYCSETRSMNLCKRCDLDTHFADGNILSWKSSQFRLQKLQEILWRDLLIFCRAHPVVIWH